MNILLHHHDLPDGVTLQGDIALDCEAMGLNHHRDRLCLLQLKDETNNVHLIKFNHNYNCPNLRKALANNTQQKLFHFARFDVATIYKYLGISIQNIYCTKIASRLARTYTDSHSLKELCRELLGINLAKQQQCSDWGNDVLTKEQQEYAAHDVLYLHELRQKLNKILERENRLNLAQECFNFILTRAKLDIYGWAESDIFVH